MQLSADAAAARPTAPIPETAHIHHAECSAADAASFWRRRSSSLESGWERTERDRVREEAGRCAGFCDDFTAVQYGDYIYNVNKVQYKPTILQL